MTKRVNPELIDDDNPEWTAEDFANARPVAEVLPKLFGTKNATEILRTKESDDHAPALQRYLPVSGLMPTCLKPSAPPVVVGKHA